MPVLPATSLSTRQTLYLVVLQCVGASALDAGLLFGLHVLIFMNPNVPVQLWPFPTTIAGDMFVSLLLTSVLTWVIAGAMVWGDILQGDAGPLKLAPLALEPVALLAAQGGWKAWATTVSPAWDAAGWESAGVLTSWGAVAPTEKSTARWYHALGANAARGAVFGIALFVVVWPIAVGICAGVWGNDGYSNYPLAPTIFAVFGAVLGAIITPVVATLALATAGRAAATYKAQAALPPAVEGLSPLASLRDGGVV